MGHRRRGRIAGTCCFWFYRDLSIFRPLLREWRNVLGFGIFDSATIVLRSLIRKSLLSRSRQGSQCRGCRPLSARIFAWPDSRNGSFSRVSVLWPFPHFRTKFAAGSSLKDSYLKAVEYLTAIQWPALMLLVILARPLVEILLGRKWLAVGPILQIIAGALFFNFPVGLEYPTLIAAGAVRFLPAIVLAQAIVFTSLWWLGTALYGLYGGPLSMLVIVPIDVFHFTFNRTFSDRLSPSAELAGCYAKEHRDIGDECGRVRSLQ